MGFYRVHYLSPHGVKQETMPARSYEELFRRAPPDARYAVAEDHDLKGVVVVDFHQFALTTYGLDVTRGALNYAYKDLDQAIMGTMLTYKSTHLSMLRRAALMLHKWGLKRKAKDDTQIDGENT